MAAAFVGLNRAQGLTGPAYEVRKWSGPVSAFSLLEIQFAKSTGVTLPVLLDTDGRVARQWGVKVFPTTLMLDSRGQPRQRVKGEVDWTSSAAEKLIAGLMKP